MEIKGPLSDLNLGGNFSDPALNPSHHTVLQAVFQYSNMKATICWIFICLIWQSIWTMQMWLVETVPLSPRRGYFSRIHNSWKLSPSLLQKNKVNHINKIIITKLSLMNPCIFYLKKSICAKNLIQLINSNRFTTTCLIFNKDSSTLPFLFFRSFLKLTLSLINNVFIICFQVTEFNWISLQAGLSHNSQLSIFLLLWFFSLKFDFELKC